MATARGQKAGAGEKRRSLEHRIFKAGFFVLIAHLIFKFAGLVQAKAMGHYLPQMSFDVVYSFAFENCIFALALIASETLGPSILPLFMRELEASGESEAWRLANTVLTMLFVLLCAVTLVLVVAPEWVTKVLTHWRPENAPDKFALAVQSVRLMGPSVIGLGLGAVTYVLLNGYKRFFLAAFGDAAWKFCVVFFLLATAWLPTAGARLLIWGVVAGSLCKVLTHFYGLRDKMRFIRPAWAWHHPAFKQLCWLALPLLVGIVMAKVRDMVNNVYILSTLEQSGLIQANSMGRKLQSTLLFLIPYTLSIAVFPFFCELVDQRDNRQLGALVTRFGRMLLALFAPFAIFVAVAAVPVTALIFKGGYFDDQAVTRTAVSLVFYTFVLPAAAIEALVMQAFFANRRMWTVTLIGIFYSSLSVLISWLGLRFCATRELWVLAFIAGGFTLSRIFKAVTLVEMLKKSAPVFPWRATTSFMARMLLAAALASLASWFLLYRCDFLNAIGGRVGDLVRLAIGGSGFGIIYLGLAYALGIGEIRDVFGLVLKRLQQRT